MFNTNASKRLGIIAGVNRQSREITAIINTVAEQYLQNILQRVLYVIAFSKHKTINVTDLQFLHQICPQYPHIAYTNNFENLTHHMKSGLAQAKEYQLYTLKKSFETSIRKIIRELSAEEIRIGKNVAQVLQHLTECYIITILSKAVRYTHHSGRNTLLATDVYGALNNLGLDYEKEL